MCPSWALAPVLMWWPGAVDAGPAGHVRRLQAKFVKHFANIRAEMIKGLNLFHEETLSGAFPTPEYSFNKAVEIPSVYGPGNN